MDLFCKKKLFLYFICLVTVLYAFPLLHGVHAQTPPPAKSVTSTSTSTPLPCSTAPKLGNCPTALQEIYKSEPCVDKYEDFIQNPITNHYWALDEEVTTIGKANERARQFIYWTLSPFSPSSNKDKLGIDNHPSIRKVWTTTKNVVLFLFILATTLFGIGYIIGQRANFQLKIQIWPTILKIILGLVYILFSYAIIIICIEVSEILMKFFIENLGGDQLFNIYFTGNISQEKSYIDFIGCRDLNYKVQESIQTEFMILKITNITYYIMGIMLLLRKVLLWFLVFAGPFLAILLPFVFIRNVGIIWIGVFFQWLFYGPLFALFLGALATMWKMGIPFHFDFSRVNNLAGYVYPTGINIVYGGPAQVGLQHISPLNNGSYVDTFAEYIISLIMLWAVVFFPWWLLRIFRDYCCDGIYAMKNIMMSMYDQMRSPPKSPSSGPTPNPSMTGTSLKIPKEIEVPIKVRLETMQEIKKTRTEDITKSLNLSMKKLTDIAHFETNKQTRETVQKNLSSLQQPTKADSPVDRQKFMNIRTELFNRTIKEDRVAKQILSSITSTSSEHMMRKQELVRTMPASTPFMQTISNRTNISQQKVASLNSTFVNTVLKKDNIITSTSNQTKIEAPKIRTVLTSYKHYVGQTTPVGGGGGGLAVLDSISKDTGVEKTQVKTVITQVAKLATEDKQTMKEVAQAEQVQEKQVQQIIQEQVPLVTEPEKNIEKTVAIPASISLEDYEEVKKMWIAQYEKGEVPVSENIVSREQWVEQDTVFITNTLNKLLSADEQMRQQGVDDLGYILPIFLINNLKGEELTVYLKAKLEAAKHVMEMKRMEKEITEKLKAQSKDDEELVELKKAKPKEEAKHMTLQQELEIPDETKPKETKDEKTPPETKPNA